jgi:hypothetical protein
VQVLLEKEQYSYGTGILHSPEDCPSHTGLTKKMLRVYSMTIDQTRGEKKTYGAI